MEYFKAVEETTVDILFVNKHVSSKYIKVTADNGDSAVAIELSVPKAFEAALALVEATGTDPKNGQPGNAEEAERKALYWLNEAVAMRREEDERKKELAKQRKVVANFIRDVFGKDIDDPTENDFEIYNRAVKWAEEQNGPVVSVVLRDLDDARKADKNVIWESPTGGSYDNETVRFRYSEEKSSWEWWTKEQGWNTYFGSNLSKLSSSYFPIRSVGVNS